MWLMIFSAFIGALFAQVPAWWAFFWQGRRNSVIQVYLDTVPALYEARRTVELMTRGRVNKGGLSAAELDEVSKAFTSLHGRIGKLHLVASPKTIEALNRFDRVVSEIKFGRVPETRFSNRLREMKADDIPAQLYGFDIVLVALLTSMRDDLGYKMEKDEKDEYCAQYLRAQRFRDHGNED